MCSYLNKWQNLKNLSLFNELRRHRRCIRELLLLEKGDHENEKRQSLLLRKFLICRRDTRQDNKSDNVCNLT